MTMAQNLKALRKAAGLSQEALAERTRGAVSQQLISQLEQGVVAETTKLLALARALGVPVSAIDPEYSDNAPVAAPPVVTAVPLRNRGPLEPRGDLPVYASAQGGVGEVIISFEPIDYVGRPDALANVRDGYAMYIVGDSMSPRYEPGELALVNPHKPARSGDDVIVFRQPPIGETEAIIKRLVRSSRDEWHLRQFNPEKKLDLDKAEWPVCHVIVGRY